MTESEAQVLVDTGQFKNLLAERDRLRLANARLVAEKRLMQACINRWQGGAQSALGNVAKVVKEMQEYLRALTDS